MKPIIRPTPSHYALQQIMTDKFPLLWSEAAPLSDRHLGPFDYRVIKYHGGDFAKQTCGLHVGDIIREGVHTPANTNWTNTLSVELHAQEYLNNVDQACKISAFGGKILCANGSAAA